MNSPTTNNAAKQRGVVANSGVVFLNLHFSFRYTNKGWPYCIIKIEVSGEVKQNYLPNGDIGVMQVQFWRLENEQQR